MNTRPASRRPISPLKIGLIVTLSLVFLAVLVIQFGLPALGSASTEPEAPETVSLSPPPVPSRTTGRTESTAPSELTWPTIPIEEVIRHDPFELPSALHENAESALSTNPPQSEEVGEQAEPETDWDDLRATIGGLKVDHIIIGPNGGVATIGEHRLRVGDVFDGLRVIEINPDGILVVPATQDDQRR